MQNSEFAEIFLHIAEFLELKEENPFKIRAYQKASENIENLSKQLEQIYESGGMQSILEIPGIGKNIAEKIEILIKTGTLPLYEKLQSEFPKEFMELIQIRNLGPKTALLLRNKLNIKNINELEKAVKNGALKSVEGMGAKKEEAILKGIEQFRRHKKEAGLPIVTDLSKSQIKEMGKNKFSKLIKLKDIKGDLHVHTNASDGVNSIEEMAIAAKERGYEYIAITDHSVSSRIANGLTEKELLNQIKEIDEVNRKIKGIRILKGIELDIKPDGSLDYKDSVLKQLDVVIAAIHSSFNLPKDKMTHRLVSAMNNKYVNIIAHPTGRLIGRRDPYEIDMDMVLKTAKQTKTFIELNSNPARLDLFDIYCKKAAKMNILIAIQTDAHSPGQYENIVYGILTARQGWLEKKDVLNTLPPGELIRKLKQKR